MSENKGGEIIGSFLTGALIGAAIGILFAPKTGKATRLQRGEWMDETREKTKEKFEKLEDEIKNRKEHLLKSTN